MKISFEVFFLSEQLFMVFEFKAIMVTTRIWLHCFNIQILSLMVIQLPKNIHMFYQWSHDLNNCHHNKNFEGSKEGKLF